MGKNILIIMIFLKLMFLVGEVSAEKFPKHKKNVSFQEARIIAVSEFNKQTGDTFKVFKCTLVEENVKNWRFVFDEFDNPPSPGALIFVFVDKINGKVDVSWGR